MSDLAYIREHLEGVEKFTNSLSDKAVLNEIMTGRCKYLIGRSSGKRVGFVVYSIRDKGHWLEMYVVYAWSGVELGGDLFDSLVGDIKRVARGCGCREITFHSSRLGWVRKLMKHGFTEVPQIKMRCDLEEKQWVD